MTNETFFVEIYVRLFGESKRAVKRVRVGGDGGTKERRKRRRARAFVRLKGSVRLPRPIAKRLSTCDTLWYCKGESFLYLLSLQIVDNSEKRGG